MNDAVVDLYREVERALDTLTKVHKAMRYEAKMNAAKHLSSQVMPNPLASLVSATVDRLVFALNRHRTAAAQAVVPEPDDAETAVPAPSDVSCVEGHDFDGDPPTCRRCGLVDHRPATSRG